MPSFLECPFLGGLVEFNDERREHIESVHPREARDVFDELASVVCDPDVVFETPRQGEHALARAQENHASHFVVAIVVTEDVRSSERVHARHWVVTAYISRRLPRWRILWRRS
ncbi:MAG: hypothetical protein ACKVT1_05360 [Dehalococcoidia bacterium]